MKCYSLWFLLLVSNTVLAQLNEKDSLQFVYIINSFQKAIAEKDSTSFKRLFFHDKVAFTGIMSQATENSIKQDYPEFEGVAVSESSRFIREICLSKKAHRETFYNVRMTGDGNIAQISFDYAYYSSDKLIQWGHEMWQLARDGKRWLITDVTYSIRFPKVEAFPFGE